MVYESRQARRNSNILAFGMAEWPCGCLRGTTRALDTGEYVIYFALIIGYHHGIYSGSYPDSVAIDR